MWLSPLPLIYAITAPTVGGHIDLARTTDLEHSLWIKIEALLVLGINMFNTPMWSPVVSGVQYLLWDACLVFNTFSGVLYCDWLTWTIHIYLSDQLLYVCSVGDLNCFYIHSMTVLHSGGAVPCTCMCWQCYIVEGPYHVHICVDSVTRWRGCTMYMYVLTVGDHTVKGLCSWGVTQLKDDQLNRGMTQW